MKTIYVVKPTGKMSFLYKGPSRECARRMLAIAAVYNVECDVIEINFSRN